MLSKFNAAVFSIHTYSCCIHRFTVEWNRCVDKSVQLKTNTRLNKWPAIFHGKRYIQITPDVRKLGENAATPSACLAVRSPDFNCKRERERERVSMRESFNFRDVNQNFVSISLHFPWNCVNATIQRRSGKNCPKMVKMFIFGILGWFLYVKGIILYASKFNTLTKYALIGCIQLKNWPISML